MFNMGLLTNLLRARTAFAATARAVPAVLASAMGRNANRIFEESKRQLETLVYDTPQRSYVRTGQLRDGQKMRRAGLFTWVIYNEKDYALAVHDGTERMPPRPWIQNAIDMHRVTSREEILNGVTARLQFDAGAAE